MLLRAEDVSIDLGKKRVVHSARVCLRGGELVGLIGPNGAGKSTLIKAMAGLLGWCGGRMEILGEECSRHLPHPAKQVAYLSQSREVHWPLSVRRIVSLGRLPHLQPWESLGEADEKVVEQAMEEADVAHLADRSVHELAGGELALVLLARILANEPSLILADEPVAGLDPNHQIQVLQLLRRKAAQGTGILVVLHDLSLAARYCHRLYMIHEGRILAEGTPGEVLTPANLRSGYGIEAKINQDDDGFYVIPRRRL